MKSVLLGSPSYNGMIHQGSMIGLMRATGHKDVQTELITVESSSVCWAFNTLWCAALNRRKGPMAITHFAMLHDDIAPEPYWLDKMLAIMEGTKADVLSVIVPQKRLDGITSTAFDVSKGDGTPEDQWLTVPLRLDKAHQAEPNLHHEKLLLNTGVMLVDMSKPWVEEVCFEFQNRIIKGKDGLFKPVQVSEDWFFSREAAKRGARLFATREVSVKHIGRMEYPNQPGWSSIEFKQSLQPQQ